MRLIGQLGGQNLGLKPEGAKPRETKVDGKTDFQAEKR